MSQVKKKKGFPGMTMGGHNAIIWLSSDKHLPVALGDSMNVVSLRVFASIDELARKAEHGVALLTAEQATNLLHLNSATDLRIVIELQDNEALAADFLSKPAICGVFAKDSPREMVVTTFKSALDLSLRDASHTSTARTLEKILEIGRALASEKDLDTLLDLILTQARHLTGADGSSIYTRDNEGKLYFRLFQNASTQATSNAQKTLAGDYSVAGYVARSGDIVNVHDAYEIPEDAPYKFNPASDKSLNYRTRSMLTLPLKNKTDDVVGVLQLINRKLDFEKRLTSKKDFEELVLPFDNHTIEITKALAGQAGVALENSILYEDIEKLFEGFIRASVQAIEARDPTTAGHSFRVAEFTERLSKAVDRSDLQSVKGVQFSKDQLREIRYAALLHDFGKVGVRENVLVKANKLYEHQLAAIEQRFQYARTSLGRHAFREIIDLYEANELSAAELKGRRLEIEEMLAQEDNKLNRFLESVLTANRPSVLHESASEELKAIRQHRFPDFAGDPMELLQEFEFTNLSLSKGSLSPEERQQIESHVSHTFEFLSLIPWTRTLLRCPILPLPTTRNSMAPGIRVACRRRKFRCSRR
jgi:HD-GYP domain-containing protein (c-di-GMP phosphodiesterase class II)